MVLQEKSPIRLSGGRFYFIQNTPSGQVTWLVIKKIYIDVSRTGSRTTNRTVVLDGWPPRPPPPSPQKFETLVDLMNFKITRYLSWFILSDTHVVVRLPEFIYIHASCMSSHVCWRVLVGWIEMKWAIHYAHKSNEAFFFFFFSARCWTWVVLEIASGHLFINFQVLVLVRLLFPFFFNSEGQACGGHIRSFFSDFQKGLECLLRLLVGWIERGTQNSFCTQIEQK